LTVTFGFGPKLVELAGSSAAGIQPLPKFSIDRLQERWNDGDLLLHIASDDQLTVAHAQRMLLKDARRFASVKWVQPGFRRSRGSEATGTTMRNLFGQVDGTVNPSPQTADFNALVWNPDGSTTMVIRRIQMDVDTWDEVDRSGREFSVGRTLANGAPTTGSQEHDEPDFEATNALGFTVIPAHAHIRRARSENPSERIFRRGYNYDEQPTGTDISDSGLIFVSYQQSVAKQFVPLQQRLAELDALNQWTTPIGSAVFLIPPGCAEGGFVGETLFKA
ncbi:Dyp-type peroxidase, partial [Glutamicibacter sp. AOP3-A1-12]